MLLDIAAARVELNRARPLIALLMYPLKHIPAHLLNTAPFGALLHDIQARLISNPSYLPLQRLHLHAAHINSFGPTQSHSNMECSDSPPLSVNQVQCIIQPFARPSAIPLEHFDEHVCGLSVLPYSPSAAPPTSPQPDSSTPSTIYSTSMNSDCCQSQPSLQSRRASCQASLIRQSIDLEGPSGSGPCQADYSNTACGSVCMPLALPNSYQWEPIPCPRNGQLRQHKASSSQPFPPTIATEQVESRSCSSSSCPHLQTQNELADSSDCLKMGNSPRHSSDCWSLPVGPNDSPCPHRRKAWCPTRNLKLQQSTAEMTPCSMPHSHLLQPGESIKPMLAGSCALSLAVRCDTVLTIQGA